RLQEMDQIQREEYPSLHGRSRREAYPGLEHSGRPYSRAWERRHWQLEPVLAELASHAVPRKVDGCGSVSLYSRNHYVGIAHAGKRVFVMFDPERREWVFSDDGGQQLRSHPAEEICRPRIEGLTVTNPRDSSGRTKRRRPESG